MTTPPTHRFTLGDVTVTIANGYTHTQWSDGVELWAAHDDVRQLGQSQTAEALGYSDVQSMNAAHDLLHTLLSVWLGLHSSPVLRAQAEGLNIVDPWIEEDAVLLLQRLIQARGIDLIAIAQRMTTTAPGGTL